MAAIIFDQKAGPSYAGILQIIEFDAALQAAHDFGVDITSHPIEQGANISDHAKPQQPTLTLQALVTNTPLNETTIGTYYPPAAILMQPQMQFITVETRRFVHGGPVIGPIVASDTRFVPRAASKPVAEPGVWVTDTRYFASNVLQSPERVERARALFEILTDLCLNVRPVQLVLDNATYDQVLIEKLSVPEEAEDSLKFSMTFKKVRFVSTKVVSITKKKPAAKRAEVVEAQGPKAGYKKPDEEEEIKSVLERSGARQAITGNP